MGRKRDEESRGLRFQERDVVLAKVAGSPLWPSVIRQCEVDKNDPNYQYNGMFYRNPDWYVIPAESFARRSATTIEREPLTVFSYACTGTGAASLVMMAKMMKVCG